MGKRPAVAMAKIVIASDARENEGRNLVRNRYRIAEMRVPECAIPIQKTKQVMYIAHITGHSSPVTPMPMYICQPQDTAPISVSRPLIPSHRLERRLVGRWTGRSRVRDTAARLNFAG